MIRGATGAATVALIATKPSAYQYTSQTLLRFIALAYITHSRII